MPGTERWAHSGHSCPCLLEFLPPASCVAQCAHEISFAAFRAGINADANETITSTKVTSRNPAVIEGRLAKAKYDESARKPTPRPQSAMPVHVDSSRCRSSNRNTSRHSASPADQFPELCPFRRKQEPHDRPTAEKNNASAEKPKSEQLRPILCSAHLGFIAESATATCGNPLIRHSHSAAKPRCLIHRVSGQLLGRQADAVHRLPRVKEKEGRLACIRGFVLLVCPQSR